MPHTFTTLRHPVEKLLEAEHFLARLVASQGLRYQFELNAFLSASRSVTFVLQKTLAKVDGFAQWYEQQQAWMTTDPAMRFFMELRNISQKQGPVSFVGGSLLGGGWTYRFVGQSLAVPAELTGRDIAECCAAHITKLATLLAQCTRSFPYHSCPGRALTEEGMSTLGYSWQDIEAALGLPLGFTEVADIPDAEKLRLLSSEIEPLDHDAIQRIASGDIQGNGKRLQFVQTSGNDLLDDIANKMTPGSAYSEYPRGAYLAAIMKRIDESSA